MKYLLNILKFKYIKEKIIEFYIFIITIKYLFFKYLPLTSETLYNSSSKSDNWAVLAITSFFMKNGVWIFL